ncbi:MAG TPA: ABC transporter substrate-binding protein [Terriglobales bacterium]
MGMKIVRGLLCALLMAGTLAPGQNAPLVVRVGYFPNITHAQALAGRQNGWFDKALAPQARVEWKAFHAGPSIIEALFAGELDLAYVGPSPAITGYLRSQGQALRIIAGATSGGAALVVRSDSGIRKPEDFHGKRIASPQFGNTQDVALRAWMEKHGLKPREKGGDVQVVPVANPDQLTLFLRKQLDASWAPEPWASRLIHDGNGRLFLDERDEWPEGRFAAALLIVARKFLDEHPDTVKQWLRAHVEVTQWINQNPARSRQMINAELAHEVEKPLSNAVLQDAFSRLQATYDPMRDSILVSARRAADLGLLGIKQPDVSGILDLTILNSVLAEKRSKPIQ